MKRILGSTVALRLVLRSGPIVTALAAVLALLALAGPSWSAAVQKIHQPAPAPASADLATGITTLSTAQPTGVQYFHVTVTNNGPGPASNIVITGGTPRSSTFHCVTGDGAACGSVVPGVTCEPPTSTAPLTCTTASLKGGTSVSVWMGFSHGFLFPGQAYCDSASVTSTTPDPNTTNNTAVACARVG
jgi:uncharacterized repeat protein (TIGR01451 family)